MHVRCVHPLSRPFDERTAADWSVCAPGRISPDSPIRTSSHGAPRGCRLSALDALGPVGERSGPVTRAGALVVLFGVTSDHFLTRLTFTTLANQIPALTVIAVGLTLVLIAGGIDLSVGSVMALASAVLALALVEWRLPLPLAIVLCLAIGLAAGLINGFVTVRWAVPSFIVTVGMLEAARGAAYLATGSRSVFVGAASVRSARRCPASVCRRPSCSRCSSSRRPGAADDARCSAVTSWRSARTPRRCGCPASIRGRWSPPCSASRARSPVWPAICHLAYLESADPNSGIGLELSAIAAVVIGGTSLMGGRGSVVSGFFGV